MDSSGPLAPALTAMLAIQELDDQALVLKRRRKALEDECQAHAKAADGFKSQRAALDQAKAERAKRQRGMEAEIKVKDAELKKLTARSREVRGQEAIQAHAHELEAAKAALSKLEDELLKVMDADEAAAAKAKDEAARLDAALAGETAAGAQATAAMAALDAELAALEADRTAKLAALGGEHAATYARYHKGNHGKVVALVKEGLCGSCKVKVPVHQVGDARKARAFQYCQNCGVMLAVLEA